MQYQPFPSVTDRAFLRHSLQTLSRLAPGKAVEVRVVPVAAVQCIPGVSHTRGTPPNVVEMDAPTWHALLTGELEWDKAVNQGKISASGTKADISQWLTPLRAALLAEQNIPEPPQNR